MTPRTEVQQLYRYTYSAPITDVHQRLVMVPPDVHRDQRLIHYSFAVRGADPGWELEWCIDQFGNRVCRARVPSVQHVLELEAQYVVEHAISPASSAPASFARDVFLQPTALTAPDGRLSEVATDIGSTAKTPEECAERAHDWAARAIAYQVGATGVRTPAAMALHLGRGVCQDYAHVLLCLLRLLGIPARYVSGQLPGDGVAHAWVEALIGDTIIAYDPTHHRRTSCQYVSVAVGRDYADVTPTSGTFTGAATGVLSATKCARAVCDKLAAEDAA